MKRLFLWVFLPLGGVCCSQDAGPGEPLRSLVVRLASDDGMAVQAAMFELVALEAISIPALLALAESKDRRPLRNTQDLIYPGAPRYLGHGQKVDYALEWTAARAGWTLEHQTFHSFGFREGILLEAPPGQGGLTVDRPVRDPRSAEERLARLAKAAGRAREWWSRQGRSWTRLTALREALASGDADRQEAAVNWLRHEITPCAGLNLEVYRRDLMPLVAKLAHSGRAALAEAARDLLEDHKNHWLMIKRPSPVEVSGEGK